MVAMLLTRETDYALRMLRCLLDGEKKPVGDIASQGMVPQQFAYKIIKKLSRAGLVEVTRGTEGGCRLSADLTRTSLYDLMAAMEDQCSVNACLQPGYSCPWAERNAGCGMHQRFLLIQSRIDGELRAHSLVDLLTEP